MGSKVDATTTPSTLVLNTPELPAEVILSILEELHEIQDTSGLRTVSKQFDALIVSLSYRHVHLTERILAPFINEQKLNDDASTVQLQVACDVKNHARHLTIKRNLDWSSVARLIESLRNLRSFTWAYWPSEEPSPYESPNSTIGPALCKRWPNVKLRFDGVRASTHRSSDFRNFPNSNLVSCKVAAWERHEFAMIRELSFERPRLQELHLLHETYNNMASMRPKIEVREDQETKSLPALRTLVIDGYDWNYSQWEMARLWNWANITHLELKNVYAIELLQHVPPRDLAGLKIFIEECESNYEESKYKRKSILLCDLVRHTTALEELRIHCETQQSEIVSALARNCLHLRILRLLCFIPYCDYSSWTALTLDQLDTIGSNCPHLMQIEVDVVLPTFSHAMYAKARSTPRIVETPASTINTRSMSRTQAAKREANAEIGDHVHDAKLKDAQTKQKIPRWYVEAYDSERDQKPGYVSWRRTYGLNASSAQQRISYNQARNEYLAWKQTRRKEEVATMRSQASIDSAPALARFRNLRRLRVFTTLHHFTAQEPDDKTAARTRKAVRNWLNELLSKKQGAKFEEVVVYATVDVINEKKYTRPEYTQMTFTYMGKVDAGGNAEIGEEYGHLID